MKKLILILIIIPLISLSGQGNLYQPFNLNFENAESDILPQGWSIPSKVRKMGYQAFATTKQPFEGKYCVELTHDKDTTIEDMYGSVVQSIDASPYVGKTIRISAAIRAEIHGQGSARLWVHERMANEQTAYINLMEDNPIVVNEWERYSIEYTVTENAATINYGLLLFGKGYAWIDDVNIEVVNELKDIEAPKNLTDFQKQSLLSFAKLYGNIKFYHPSKESYNADWGVFSYKAIKEVEKAENTEELKDKLFGSFKSIAPTLKIFSDKSSAEKVEYEKPEQARDDIGITYKTKVFFKRGGSGRIGTEIVNIYSPQKAREAAAFQILDAEEFKGREITFKAKSKVEPYGFDANAQLWMRIDYEDNTKDPIKKTMDHNPIRSSDWKEYSISAGVPKDAKYIRIGLVFLGEGEAWFDDAAVEISAGGMSVKTKLNNGSFSEKWYKNKIQEWRIPNSSINTGYTYIVDTTENSKDGHALKIYTDRDDYTPLPEAGKKYVSNLGSNLYATFPVSVYSDGSTTLPQAEMTNEDSFALNPNDRITKIASFVEFWNYLKHYSILKYKEVNFDSLFIAKIENVSLSNDNKEFLDILNSVLKLTKNNMSDAWRTTGVEDYSLPFLLEFKDDDIIIGKSYTEKLKKGTKIISIGNKNLKNFIENELEYMPGKSKTWNKKKAVRQLLQGEYNSEVDVTFEENGKRQTGTFVRNTASSKIRYERPPTLSMLDSLVVYIDATRIDDREMKKVTDKIDTARGIIVDLRGNSMLSEHFLGFFLTEAVRTIDWDFNIYTDPNIGPSVREIKGVVEPQDLNLTPNVVFLTDESTVAYAEILLHIVKHYGIGPIVGTKTSGSAGDVSNMRLFAGYNFSVNYIPFKLYNGEEIENKRTEPDHLIEEKGDFPEDPVINKAYDIIKGNF